MATTAQPSFSPPTGLYGSSDGKIGGSSGSLDIDAILDSVLMRDPVALGTELVPPALLLGLGLATDMCQGQQGSNGRKQGSGSRLPATLPRLAAQTPPGIQVSGSLPHSGGAKANHQHHRQQRTGDRAAEDAEGEMMELALVHQKQAAVAGAAAAQAAYAHHQQQAATAMAAAAYTQQQVYAQQQQTQQQQQQQQHNQQPVASSQRGAYMQQQQQAQQQAQAQQAAYMQAYHQQAAAYAAASGQYPGANAAAGGWMPHPYSYAQYYSPQQYMQQYCAAAAAPGQYQNMQAVAGGGGGANTGATAAAAAAVTAGVDTVAAAATGAPVTATPMISGKGDGCGGGGDGGGIVEEGEDAHAVKKPRLIWTQALHKRFIESVDKCGGLDHALPKAIMKHMGLGGLTRENVASHLQKYRMRLKREELTMEGGDGETVLEEHEDDSDKKVDEVDNDEAEDEGKRKRKRASVATVVVEKEKEATPLPPCLNNTITAANTNNVAAAAVVVGGGSGGKCGSGEVLRGAKKRKANLASAANNSAGTF